MSAFLRHWLPLLGLLLFAALALYLARAPRPVPASAPATAFSAERALREVAVVARGPHSLGTPANAAVRDHLLRRCRALGLTVTMQDTTVVVPGAPGSLTGARVQNVVARLPGRKHGGPAVLVLSHYDSQPHTPGASDDGAGVAAAIETMRALRAGPPLAHDVLWVFTDGEEVGLLGAIAYTADTARLRRTVGVVLNFEARGNAGPSLLFEVSSGNTWVLEEFTKAAPAPLGSSLAYEIYRYLPNGTDFTAFRAAGLPGLNFAFTGGYAYYHSPADTPERLDLASLQHQGDYMLPLVRHFANISLAHAPTSDSTFFNPLGTWLVRYDAGWNQVLNVAGLALLLAAVVRARQRGRLRLAGLLGGALAWLIGATLVLATGWALARVVVATYPQYAVFYDHAFYNVGWYHLALVALGTAVFTAYYGALRRWLRPDSLIGGVLVVLAALQAFLQVKAPTSGFLLGFPILGGALGWLWQTLTTPPLGGSRGRRAVFSLPLGPVGALLAVPAVALLAPNLRALLTLAGLGPLVLASLFFLVVLLGLLLPALLPALGRTEATGPRWALPLLAGAVALGALAAAHATSQPTAEHPQQTHVFYALDANRGEAYWLSSMAQPDAWTRQFFPAPTVPSPLPALFPNVAQPVLHQRGPRLPLAAPTVTVLADSTLPNGRRLRLRVRPGRPGVVSLRLLWPSIKFQSFRVAGHVVDPNLVVPSNGYGTLTFFAPGQAGVVLEIELAPADAKRMQLIATDRTLGLPAAAKAQPLPAEIVAAPGYSSFTTQVTKRFRL